MGSLTFATVYSDFYTSKNEDECEEWIRNKVTRATGLRERFWRSRHVMRIYETQSVARMISNRALRDVRKEKRLSELDARLGLRKLQHRILRHVWRPGGRMESASRRNVEAVIDR